MRPSARQAKGGDSPQAWQEKGVALFERRKYLEAMAEATEGIRKYVVAASGVHVAYNLQDPMTAAFAPALEAE